MIFYARLTWVWYTPYHGCGKEKVPKVNTHGEKAKKAYASFVRHFENTYTPDTRAAMLGFYQKLFVKEVLAAKDEAGLMTEEDVTQLLQMQEDMSMRIRQELERVWTAKQTKGSSTQLKPINQAAPKQRIRIVGGNN